ncbi:hypothetical protein ONZ45_g9353 [Pleurotus djamor]|nr:hypothetical protein ONZ45_g9353 [Pleurotus djamor]
MTSLAPEIASSLSKVYTALHRQYSDDPKTGCLCFNRSESCELGKTILKPFDETVKFAESAKKTWGEVLEQESADRVLAIVKVKDNLAKSKMKIQNLEETLRKKNGSETQVNRDTVDEGLHSTALYVMWCDGLKSDLVSACQNSKDAMVLRGLSDKCNSYAEEVRPKQDRFRDSFK